jgi:hypothetical protein
MIRGMKKIKYTMLIITIIIITFHSFKRDKVGCSVIFRVYCLGLLGSAHTHTECSLFFFVVAPRSSHG